jgi:glyoxylase-like metal-dependent hydrolase (beta-lactamase superfamily II)
MDIEVLYTPGHSPGHLAYAISPSRESGDAADPAGEGAAALGARDAAHGGDGALFSGDVLFAGSVGRVDLPGGDWATLERSIAALLRDFPAETVVYPGHMGVTTLARERDTNPFLSELRSVSKVTAEAHAPASRR